MNENGAGGTTRIKRLRLKYDVSEVAGQDTLTEVACQCKSSRAALEKVGAIQEWMTRVTKANNWKEVDEQWKHLRIVIPNGVEIPEELVRAMAKRFRKDRSEIVNIMFIRV